MARIPETTKVYDPRDPKGASPVAMRFDSARVPPQAANDDHGDAEEYVERDVLPDFLKRDKVLSDFTHPGGFMEEVIDWITSSAETPSRELALSATLPFVASLIGRRFGTTSRDTRANMYVVALAPSGFGKDHARGQLKRLRVAADGWLDKFFGPERLMSASALRNELQDSPSRICLIDEFGGFVRDITDRKAAAHMRGISTDLRDLWSASGSLFGGAAYANTKAVTIHNPNLNIYGTATPGQFWSAMRNASAEDGLLPRFLLFSLERAAEVDLVVPAVPVSTVPVRIIDRAVQLAGINRHVDEKPKLGKILERVDQEGGKAPMPVVGVAWTDDALDALAAFKRSEVKATREAEEIVSPFIARTTEYAIKLALILAVTSTKKNEKRDGRGKLKATWSRPLVDMACWEWASGLAVRCIADMVSAIDKFVSDNEKEAVSKQIRETVQKAKEKGITEGGIIRSLPEGHNARIRIEALDDLVLAGRIRRIEKEPTGKGGRPSVRYHRQVGTDSNRGTA